MGMVETEATLVLVDDDEGLRRALQFALEIDGFTVRAFESAEAVERGGDLPRGGCLVLDYQLPGVDGLSLLDALRRRGVGLPAVLMTTNPGRLLRRRATDAGVEIVEKPLLFDELVHAIRRAVRDASPPSQG